MAYDGLNWQVMNLPFRAGLMQKADDRARPQPFLDIARDIQFDELGGVQLRFPFLNLSNQIFGGGTLANCRRLAVVNDELVVFTDTALYSWNAQLAKWVLRATHLAVAVKETPRLATTGDQIDGDRAELSGTVMYAWTEGSGSYLAAIDKVTGAMLMPPTLLGAGIVRPRLVAAQTRIIAFCVSGTDLLFAILDPANPAAGSFTVLFSGVTGVYDVARADGQDLVVGAYQRTVTTSHTVFTVSSGGGIQSSTKARTADGPLAVSTIPGGTQTQIIRANGANIQGDLLATVGLTDVFTGQAVGSGTAPINQIAACHRSVQNGGAFRCYAFWTSNQSATGLTWGTKSNWVDNAGALGAQATLVLQLSVASRAFDCNGSVYVWTAFGSSTVFASPSGFVTGTTLQNSYFLYRDDAFLCAKSVADTGGGLAPSTGRLPGVSAISATSFAWCAAKRRKFFAGSEQTDFAARSPVDVEFSFDSNEARRMARIGRTGYIAAGEILQYDGTRLVECGFHIFPWAVGAIEVPGGSLTAGSVYAYKGTYRYQNGQIETERSTTATIGTITLTTGTRVDLLSASCLTVTHKLAVPPAIELWRTAKNPPDVDAPFKLITSNDPAGGNPNRYLSNDPVAGFAPTVQDVLADTSLGAREANPENGAVLESLAPPAARIIIATDTRVYLADVAGDPDAVWYSRLRNEGEIASFHDGNRALVPRPGGRITALAIHQETPTVFRETAVYRLAGDGLNNLGQGQNFVAFEVPGGVGSVNQESIASTPLGTVFKSSKGWCLLTPGWGVQYIGAAVADYDGESILAVTLVDKQHQVRIVTSGGRMIGWDYSAATEESPLGQWFEWTVGSAVDALMWQGQYVILTPTGPAVQRTTYTGGDFGIDVETAWIKLADLQGAAAVRKVQPFGEYRSACLLWVRIAYNYKQTGGVPDYVDSKVWTPSPAVVGGPLQLKHGTKRIRCESIKVRLTAVAEGVRASLITSALAPQVTTSGTVWTSTWLAAAAAYPGEIGNTVTMSVAVEDGSPFSIDVRDHFAWDHALQIWVPDLNNVGVRVLCRTGSSPTVAQLEAAIAAGTTLATLSVADATPGKVVNASGMVNLTSTASFTGGTFVGPTGEGLKLTGLGLDVGFERGVFNRLPAAQRQ